MPMKVRYTVVNGEVLSENRAGVERDYLPDTQGNVIGLLDSTQTITDTFSYFPYGEVASRTGTNVTPFQFLGTMGYYRDSASRTYVRARTLNTVQGRWMTQDPIGFQGGDYNLYRYVANRPTILTDPSGLRPVGDYPERDCRSMGNKATCFTCAYFYYGGDAQTRCILANRYCGSHVNCDGEIHPPGWHPPIKPITPAYPPIGGIVGMPGPDFPIPFGPGQGITPGECYGICRGLRSSYLIAACNILCRELGNESCEVFVQACYDIRLDHAQAKKLCFLMAQKLCPAI